MECLLTRNTLWRVAFANYNCMAMDCVNWMPSQQVKRQDMQDGRRWTPGQESNATAENFQFACELSIVELEVQMLFKPAERVQRCQWQWTAHGGSFS